MKSKILLVVTCILLLVAGCAAYVGLAAGKDLVAARSILSTPVGELTPQQIDAAEFHLQSADHHLDGIPAKILRLLPVARQNLQAVESIVEAGLPTLDAAQRVLAVRTRVEEEDLLEGGRIKAELIDLLTAPLAEQVGALSNLETELNNHLGGWLLPPVWSAIEEFGAKAKELRDTASVAQAATEIAGPMLGMEGGRTYLVILMNNSELRGAGGILSGLGSMSFDDGRLRLGNFYYYAELSPEKVQRVAAPPDFIRRFGRYRSNSTVWVNTTASPDVPEVAEAAANLYALTRNVATDGVILLDPKGIAALMPPDIAIEIPRSDQSITREELPQFIYSDSYEELGGGKPARRRALLHLGEAVFAEVLKGGMNVDTLRSAGDAIAAQHIRIVSFDDTEQQVLEEAGVSGEITTDADDSLLVTIQNFGGDKMDYWMTRNLDHRCSIRVDGPIECSSEVTLRNSAPEGLPRYVVRNKSSYALYKGYLEVYIPENAKVTGFTQNDEVVEFVPETEDGRRSLGLHVVVPQDESSSTKVTYELPSANGSYSLAIHPQPLTRDARMHIEIQAPEDWLIASGDSQAEQQFNYDGDLSSTFNLIARPHEAVGLTALWQGLVDFWREPLG